MSSISERDFISWMLSEPQTLIWIPTLHRLSAAETVKHEAKCNICKCHPMIGFRYQCLKCLNFDICQECFFIRRSSSNHQYSHPIQEYCLPASSRDGVKSFVRTVRNKINKKRGRHLKQKYLAIKDDENTGKHRVYPEDRLETHIRLETLSEKLAAIEADPGFRRSTEIKDDQGGKQEMKEVSTDEHQLQDLIDALERENEDLAVELGNYYHELQKKQDTQRQSSSNSAKQVKEWKEKQEVLQEHNHRIEEELRKYKHLIKEKGNRLMKPSYAQTKITSLDKTAPPRLEPYGQSESRLDEIDGSAPNPDRGKTSDFMEPSFADNFCQTLVESHSKRPVSSYGSITNMDVKSKYTTTPKEFSNGTLIPYHPEDYFDYIEDAGMFGTTPVSCGVMEGQATISKTEGSKMQDMTLGIDDSFNPPENVISQYTVMPTDTTYSKPVRLSYVDYLGHIQANKAPVVGSISHGLKKGQTPTPGELQYSGPGMNRTSFELPPEMMKSRVLTPHLIDQTTVTFPNLNITRGLPLEEAKLDEMVEQMTAALDQSSLHDLQYHDLCTVNRV